MSIRIALNHKTTYQYDRSISLGPQVVRLRPAPHCRTPITAYSLTVQPDDHFVNWQQDPHGNFQARLVFPEKTKKFSVEVDLIADMTVINPFDFFLEEANERFPFRYTDELQKDLKPFLAAPELSDSFLKFADTIDCRKRKTIDFLVDLNQKLEQHINYVIRMEPGVQTCDTTLTTRSGSCRDSSWLLVNLLRHFGIAARFASGYLVQLTPDVKPLDGPAGAATDFTDLHAWAEVYLPGAGWIGLDPTSGLLVGEGHIPLACTPEPMTAAPISGSHEESETEFDFEMRVTRIHEDPRVTKPYSDEQWQQINDLGHAVDRQLDKSQVRLTMGGEPTFVSAEDMESAEWKTDAVGPTKSRYANDLLLRLEERFAQGGLLHYGQGKWYPGESLPRWALSCIWRRDNEPIWRDRRWIADVTHDYGYGTDEARRFGAALCRRLGVESQHLHAAYEDAWYYLWRERRLPINEDIRNLRLDDLEERTRLSRVFENQVNREVGLILPIRKRWWQNDAAWESGEWPVRAEQLFLIPGDSPMGLRLPLDALPWVKKEQRLQNYAQDPLADRASLQSRQTIENRLAASQRMQQRSLVGVGGGSLGDAEPPQSFDTPTDWSTAEAGDVIRTALCLEPRDGRLHVFMPPVDRLEEYLELIAAVEETAAELYMPVVIEGYLPPKDERVQELKVTPDPGVIEVNVQPAETWDELVDITTGVYEDARSSRLGTEKFDIDGRHTGTGGGNHFVLGAAKANDSPFLRRPDLLKSLIGFWHNHPSLSYLFSTSFIGPTSQAPRVDEGRRDAIYELKIAFEQIPDHGDVPPWLVDRVFRNLLVDLTGNTHRAEFCIDKLFSPDSPTGRLGLVELRGFEMPPHARMSLTQQLLLRTLIAKFWESPYRAELVDWGTALHDRFMLPHFVNRDFEDVIRDLQSSGWQMQHEWFAPHFEFRFPKLGEFTQQDIHVELRTAIEPWYVLGEEASGGGTARYVDSSVERLQVKVRGMTGQRHHLTCNGRRVPLHPTGTVGEFVAGIRYRAWQPPSCLHPTIPVDEPLKFDLFDSWSERSIGGCQYYVGHPGGLNPGSFPINAYEAESRRGARFFAMGHEPGEFALPADEPRNAEFPFTLDLRRHRNTAAGCKS